MQIHASSVIDQPRLNILGILSFLCGFTSAIQFQFLGQLYAGEIILVILGVLLIADKLIPTARPSYRNILDNPLFIKFLVALFLSFLGLALSDFLVNSAPKDYLRGWAKIVFLAFDITALSFLGFKNQWNLWWFGVGVGLSIFLTGNLNQYSTEAWKLAYAEPIAYLVLCISPFLKGSLVPLLIGMLGIINILLDYRSFGLIFLLIAALTWSKIHQPAGQKSRVIGLLLPVVTALIVLAFLYQTTQSEFADRHVESNTYRFGGMQVAIEAIAESPFVGHGSWAKSDRLAERYLDITNGTRSYGSVDRLYAEEIIPAHSQILQAWVEGGILGISFFVFYGYKMIEGIIHYILETRYDKKLFSLFIFSLINSSWHLFQSPFASTHRITIAFAVSIICLLDLDKKKNKE